MPPSQDNRRAQPSLPGSLALNPYPVVELTEGGVLTYCNPAALALFPDLPAQGARHPLLRAVPAFLEALKQVSSFGSPRREVRVGNHVIEQRAVRVPGTDRFQLYCVDVTAHKHAEVALRKSEDKFAQAFHASPIPSSISRLSDGCLLAVNESFVDLLGYDEARDILGRTSTALGMWPEGSNRLKTLELLAQQEEGPRRHEAQLSTRFGTRIGVTVSVDLVPFEGEACVLSTLVDITQRQQAEEGVAILKAFYENTLDTLPMQVTVVDAEARYIYMNPQALPDLGLRVWMSGKTPVEYAARRGLETAPYQQRFDWLREVISQKKPGHLEEMLPAPTGEPQHLMHVATPVLGESGEVLYVVAYAVDLTERKAFEQQLVEARQKAEDLARLKSTFLANMSHEIRTPLTGIIGFADVLKEELGEEKRELAQLIKESGARLLETLNTVLDFARLEARALEANPWPLDVGREVIEAVRLFRPLAGQKGLALDVQVPSHTLYARLDRNFIHRILNNLLSNAIKFTEEGSISVSLEEDADTARIFIQDTGIGIEPAFLPHLFEEFTQESTGSTRSHTGSGLGLAITQRLVEALHGQIEVISTKGAGTTFCLSFPRITLQEAQETTEALMS